MAESVLVNVVSGVPKGSVLGPCCFSVYVNDLCNITLSRRSKLTMYADDLVLYIQSDRCRSTIEDINNIVESNHMNLKMQSHASVSKMPPVFIEHDEIEQDSTYKYLGLIITPSLKWDEHIEQLCLREKRLLGYLYSIL